MDTINNDLTNLLQQMGVHKESLGITQRIVIIAGILIIAFVADYFCRKIVVPTIKKLTARTQATWDDYLFNDAVLDNMCHLIPPIILYVLLPFAFPHEPVTLTFILKLCWVYITAVAMKLICSFLTSLYTISSEHEKLKNHPLKGVYQMIKLIVICVGVIIIVSTLIDKDPVNILTGLGASAAILMLVFKDSIMGFVSGIQLSANNMLKVGDWITMPKYGADGTVIEVTLNTVKVRNFDNTITTIPPYLLISDSFQNWQGMQESGGRRVKRSINIDMTSVRFCTPEMLEKYRKIQLLANYVDETEKVVEEYNKEHDIDNSVLVNGRRQTNLGVFRAYLTNYLRSLPTVNQDMTCMVRQLQPTETGIPLELYFFSANKVWVAYEGIQADVFDHVLAIIPEFGLRVFQNPSGEDLRRIGVKIEH